MALGVGWSVLPLGKRGNVFSIWGVLDFAIGGAEMAGASEVNRECGDIFSGGCVGCFGVAKQML